MNVTEHLLSRHMDLELHRPVVSEEDVTACFYLWNLSGQMVGYQQYRPFQTLKKTNHPTESRYFTYTKQPTIVVWGLESLYLRSDVLFVTEGVFDAARLTRLGYPAVAVLSCDAKKDTWNWLSMLNRFVVAVCDNDENGSGKKLAKFGHRAVYMSEKDLGDSSDSDVSDMLNSVGVL